MRTLVLWSLVGLLYADYYVRRTLHLLWPRHERPWRPRIRT